MKAQICIAQVYGVGFTNLDIVTDTVLLKGTCLPETKPTETAQLSPEDIKSLLVTRKKKVENH